MRRFSRFILIGIGSIGMVTSGLGRIEAEERPQAKAIFEGEVRVEVVDMLVSVVDSIGEPVRDFGLSEPESGGELTRPSHQSGKGFVLHVLTIRSRSAVGNPSFAGMDHALSSRGRYDRATRMTTMPGKRIQTKSPGERLWFIRPQAKHPGGISSNPAWAKAAHIWLPAIFLNRSMSADDANSGVRSRNSLSFLP